MYTPVYGGDLEGVWLTNKRTYTYYRTFQKPSQGEGGRGDEGLYVTEFQPTSIHYLTRRKTGRES